MNLRLFFLMSFSLFVAFSAQLALADGGSTSGDQYSSLAAALAIGIAAAGGAIGQGKTAAAALEGISRNPAAQPKIFVPMIIGLALIESLVLYAFVIAFVKIKT